MENELGLLYMNQVQMISDNQEMAATAMAGAQDLFNYSRNQGISKFESISDLANSLAPLFKNISRTKSKWKMRKK